MAVLRERSSLKLDNTQQSNGQASRKNESQPASQQAPQDPSTSTAAAAATTILSPALITTFVLIFGGCCSNVYTLESILSLSPATGSLITFLQFLLTALFTLPTQFTTKRSSGSSSSRSSFLPGLRSRSVPLYKWLIYTTLFLTVNILNNKAFNYRISIPLHIILRSAGPVTSMLVGYLFVGRRYEGRKVIAVMLLFAGVVLAAFSDASSKAKVATTETLSSPELSLQIPGFILLFSALLLSAFMGIYTDELYRQHGRSAAVANENLFYSHTLSFPYFAAQYKSLQGEYLTLLSNASAQAFTKSNHLSTSSVLTTAMKSLVPYFPVVFLESIMTVPALLLLANAFTQIICITGVHRLSTQTTSLTVSVVLNIRKLVSLILSIWLFGNNLPFGVSIGAALVFLGGGLYSLPSRTSNAKKVKAKAEPLDKKKR